MSYLSYFREQLRAGKDMGACGYWMENRAQDHVENLLYLELYQESTLLAVIIVPEQKPDMWWVELVAVGAASCENTDITNI